MNARPDASVPVYDIVNAGSRHRFCTANFVAHNCLGLGYGVGSEKFVAVAKIMAGLDLTIDESKKIVAEYRAQNPKVVALWKRFEAGLRDTVGAKDNTFRVTLPDGEELTYRSVAKEGDITCLLPKMGEMMRCKLYGALICENVCQKFARNVFMDRCVALEDAGYEILLRVHDEVVVLVDEKDAEAKRAEVTEIMSTPPSWCKSLPLGAEATVSKFYTK